MNAEQLKQHMSHAPSEHPGSQQADQDKVQERYIIAAGHNLTGACHGAAKKSGWWTNLKTGEDLTTRLEGGGYKFNVPEKLCLIHSEVSEAMEGHRKNLADDKLPHRMMVEVELADAVIRIFDLAGAMGLDMGGAIAEKLAYNAQRADHKIENRLAENGKKF